MTSSPTALLTVIGNGAHRTGAPQSLLTVLRRTPPGVSVRAVLVGAGPLLPEYVEACDDVVVLEAPTTRGARAARIAQEGRLASAVAAIRPRSAGERLAVNTVEVEAALCRALTWPRRGRVIIREQTEYAEGVRGRLRVALLRRLPLGHLCGVGNLQAADWSRRLGRPVRRLRNVYERREEPEPQPLSDRVRFLVVGGRSPVKGIDLARAAWQRVRPRNGDLVIAGPDFPARVEGSVQYLGDVPALGRHMETVGDVFLGVSRHESYSRAVVEAALAGVPTLAWDAEGYQEQVAEFGGWLVPAGDLDALAAQISRLCHAGSEAIRAEGRRVRTRASAALDPEAAADAWWEWLLA